MAYTDGRHNQVVWDTMSPTFGACGYNAVYVLGSSIWMKILLSASFATNVPQNVTSGGTNKNCLLAPLAALFCTPLSKRWRAAPGYYTGLRY